MPQSEQSTKWRQYQQDVADYLQSIGFETRVGEILTGARNTHEIDVSARYSKAGISLLWVVECKLWSRPVHKEQVLTFCSILDDIGTDRGLFIADGGFQSGARSAAASRSISLLSLQELRASSATELYALKLDSIERRFESIIERLYAVGRSETGHLIRSRGWREPRDIKIGRIEAIGVLSMTGDAIKEARLHGLPVNCPDEFDGNHRFIRVSDWPDFFQLAEKLLDAAESCANLLGEFNEDTV